MRTSIFDFNFSRAYASHMFALRELNSQVVFVYNCQVVLICVSILCVCRLELNEKRWPIFFDWGSHPIFLSEQNTKRNVPSICRQFSENFQLPATGSRYRLHFLLISLDCNNLVSSKFLVQI